MTDKPGKVDDVTKYWNHPPPAGKGSLRVLYWINHRLREAGEGIGESAVWAIMRLRNGLGSTSGNIWKC